MSPHMRSPSPRHPVVAFMAALAFVVPSPAQAQNVVLDEGTFTVFLDGEEAGVETFAIRRLGSGSSASLLANGVVRLERGDAVSEMRPVLKTGTDRTPLQYENMIEGAEVSSVLVSATERHYVATIRSAAGQREKELRARDQAVFLDRFVAHHYYFVGPRADQEGREFPVVIPRTGEQATMTVTSVTPETFQLSTERLDARRVELRVDGATHTVWFDDQGRVLQVQIPALGYRAVREST